MRFRIAIPLWSRDANDFRKLHESQPLQPVFTEDASQHIPLWNTKKNVKESSMFPRVITIHATGADDDESVLTTINSDQEQFSTVQEDKEDASNKLLPAPTGFNPTSQLYNLCVKAHVERGSETSFKEIQQWLSDNKNNQDLLEGAANYKNKHNCTPLHPLVAVQPPSFLVAILIQLAPDIVKVEQKDGELPLHNGCKHGASPVVVSMLLKAYPKGAEVQQRRGWLPLHVACWNEPSLDVMTVLLAAYPKGAEIQNKNGRLPLHLACWNYGSPDFVRILLKSYPDGAKIQDRDGRLPLHLACWNHASPDAVKMLLKSYPGGVKIKDCNGWLPIHIASINGAFVDVMKMLLQAYPKGEKLINDGKPLLDDALTNIAVSKRMNFLLSPNRDTGRDTCSRAASASVSICITNTTTYTLHVTLNSDMQSQEMSTIASQMTEEYHLDEDCKATRITITDNHNHNMGWVQNKLVKKGITYTVKGNPNLCFQ